WNKFAKLGKETRYHARKELESPSLKQLAGLDDRQFREMFRGGPITRIGRDRFVRNVLYAIGNSNLEEFLPVVQKLKADPEPVVADAACWAEKQLVDAD
ncbi:MAG: epoxyqueuosine reductase, partial [Rhodobacteraceae bacterium]|nr:epoxyqueuosine reductase [Paracoccaceae bacterium]